MQKQSNHGGSRPNSGRKAGPATKTISFRIDPSHELHIKEVVRKTIKKLKKC